MEIKSLTIFSKQIEKQKDFYSNILEFSYSDTTNGFFISTQKNKLQFEKSEKHFYYHFAFLIPTGSIDQAIDFLEQKCITLLKHKGQKIIQFDSGSAIYFYDKDENIVEFIERPLLKNYHNGQFSIKSVIKLNEIGLPHKNALLMSDTLVTKYGITPLSTHNFSSSFCWVGDHNGVIIVTKKGRNWLPTNKPGMINDFIIHYTNGKQDYQLSFENNKITSLFL